MMSQPFTTKKGYKNSNIRKKMVVVKQQNKTKAGVWVTSTPDPARVITGKGFVYNILWYLVISFSILTCSYQIYDRFNVFFSRPIDTRVSLIRNSSVKFPAITLCPGPSNFMPLVDLRKQKATEARLKNYCEVPPESLLNDTLNITTLWDLMSVNGILQIVTIFSRSSLLGMKQSYNLADLSIQTVTKTIYGTCTTYSFKNLIPFLKDEFVILFMSNVNPSVCNPYTLLTYMLMNNDDNDNDSINYKILTGFKEMKPRQHFAYGLTAKRFKVLNRTEQPCETNKAVKECEINCLENDLKNKNISHCRLPFTSPFDMPWCANENDTTRQMKNARDLISTFNYFQKCKCPKICDEILYTDHLKLIEMRKQSMLSIYFADNIIEEIEEYYSYGFIPFICDVGGNLGLFLGLSIPTAFEFATRYMTAASTVIYSLNK